WDPPRSKSELQRYAALEDLYRVGGAWWVWKQACGDPHSIRLPGMQPPSLLIRLRYFTCPGDVDLGFVPEWIEVLSRPYPRAVPGRLLELTSDPTRAVMTLVGETSGTGRAELWVPRRAGAPRVTGQGAGRVDVQEVEGGYRVTVQVTGRYRLQTSWAER
ncbi:MAG: hypothetical protein ONB06_03180, partial [candidate division KSB1 bacterium]|nr:hypothetical protein [candidate division KSB1 bacterium]